MNPRDRVRLQHLADALNSAIRFVQGRERGDLDRDEMLLFALVRAVEIAGEAASQITDETRAQLPDLPWNSMVGMRNRLVHAYFDINRDILRAPPSPSGAFCWWSGSKGPLRWGEGDISHTRRPAAILSTDVAVYSRPMRSRRGQGRPERSACSHCPWPLSCRSSSS